MKMTLIFHAATAALLVLSVGAAQALVCTATLEATNPDASLTHSTTCGPGTAAATDSDAAVNAAELSGLTWTSIDKDEDVGDDVLGALRSTNTPGGMSGNWGIDTSIGSYSNYLIVIKDGGVKNSDVNWFWFVVDMAGGCSENNSLTGLSLCGDWTMYGDGGKTKAISHMSLYGTTSSSGTTPGSGHLPIAGTSSLVLLGLGLLGLSFTARKRRGVSSK